MRVEFVLWFLMGLSVICWGGIIWVVAGLEELEEFGRECDSPRKRPVHWFGVMGSFMLCRGKMEATSCCWGYFGFWGLQC